MPRAKVDDVWFMSNHRKWAVLLANVKPADGPRAGTVVTIEEGGGARFRTTVIAAEATFPVKPRPYPLWAILLNVAVSRDNTEVIW